MELRKKLGVQIEWEIELRGDRKKKKMEMSWYSRWETLTCKYANWCLSKIRESVCALGGSLGSL